MHQKTLEVAVVHFLRPYDLRHLVETIPLEACTVEDLPWAFVGNVDVDVVVVPLLLGCLPCLQLPWRRPVTLNQILHGQAVLREMLSEEEHHA